ncbi:MAG TPA: hypothetical protein VHU84_18895 [Lacipirellulaceae bacterium]|jgi:hypothetical protein|nr:hypothetical protein [Lacipirellulaceae bacterium]
MSGLASAPTSVVGSGLTGDVDATEFALRGRSLRAIGLENGAKQPTLVTTSAEAIKLKSTLARKRCMRIIRAVYRESWPHFN